MSSEPLGTRSIEGVNTVGTRYTMTYPENFMGNDRPITIDNSQPNGVAPVLP